MENRSSLMALTLLPLMMGGLDILNIPPIGGGSSSSVSKIWDGAHPAKGYEAIKKGNGYILIAKEKVNRNSECPCGSGKKYKKCCLLTKGVER